MLRCNNPHQALTSDNLIHSIHGHVGKPPSMHWGKAFESWFACFSTMLLALLCSTLFLPLPLTLLLKSEWRVVNVRQWVTRAQWVTFSPVWAGMSLLKCWWYACCYIIVAITMLWFHSSQRPLLQVTSVFLSLCCISTLSLSFKGKC